MRQVKLTQPVRLLDEWTPTQFAILERKICQHFQDMKLIDYRTGNGKSFYPANLLDSWEGISNFLGLAFTSSSSYAGYWACNVEALSPDFTGYHYDHFAISQAGTMVAVLTNEEEKELFIEL